MPFVRAFIRTFARFSRFCPALHPSAVSRNIISAKPASNPKNAVPRLFPKAPGMSSDAVTATIAPAAKLSAQGMRLPAKEAAAEIGRAHV